jgi:hypothetical protein
VSTYLPRKITKYRLCGNLIVDYPYCPLEEPIAEENEQLSVDENPTQTEEKSQTPGFTALFAITLIAGAAMITRQKSNR